MKIAFFGTSDRSIPLLNSLKNSEFELALCVTKEDAKVGRKQELKSTAVKTWAQENGVQCVTLEKLDPETTEQTASTLKQENIELGVVADFSFMIPEALFNLPKHKFVNIHFSLLPKYRGASPVQQAILNLDKKTGISYQIITKGMDEGPIIHQTEYLLNGTETTDSLYNTLFEISAGELPKILLDYVEGKSVPQKQNHEQATYTYSPLHPKSTLIFKEDAQIDWNLSQERIDAVIRAYNPWPIAWSTLENIEKKFGKLKQGKNPQLKVKFFGNETVQVEGKSKISWNEFKNGYLEI